MTPNFWFCVIYVMQRLKVFNPYLAYIQSFLDVLDYSVELKLKTAREWIQNCPEYPKLKDFRNRFGYNWDMLIKTLHEEGDIIIDGDEIIYTAADNPQLQKLINSSVRIR